MKFLFPVKRRKFKNYYCEQNAIMTTNGANGVLKRTVSDSNAPLKKPKLSSESEQEEAHASTANGHADDHNGNHVNEQPQQHNGMDGRNNNDAEASNSSALDAKKHKKKKHKKEKKRKKDKHGDGDEGTTNDNKIKKKHKKDKKHKKHKKKHKTKHADAEDGDDDASRTQHTDASNMGATVKSETPDDLSQNLRDVGSSSLSPPKLDAPLRTKREMMDDDDARDTFDGDDASDEDYGGSSSKKPHKKSSSASKKASSSKKSSSVGKKAPASSASKNSKSQKASENVSSTQSKRAVKKEKEEAEQAQVWRWWEDQVGGKEDSTVKWSFLEHKGPVFAPPYEPVPASVRFFYDGKPMKLSNEAEEVATFYARMLDHDYVTKDVFNKNFFKDWRRVMTTAEREAIKDLKLCNFKEYHAHFKQLSEERKAMTKEQKDKLKQENARLQAEYGFCKLDGYQQKIANFRIEPPGLFRGRGDHPKMGMLKRRVKPEDVIINCSKDAHVPKPPAGHKWQQVRHDNTVTWLCSWTDNIMNSSKYMMLNPSSKLKGQKDLQKYEKARQLHKKIDKIRETYRHDWKAKEMEIRQRATALYLIDKLALRAGNEKEEGEAADTVGCCSLRVEHIRLEEKLPAGVASSSGGGGGDDDEQRGGQFLVHFDFLGKDSIPYQNTFETEKRVFRNLGLFCENKKAGDDLFDRLDTAKLNKHLNSLMDGLTAKVFRTYNASITLQQELRRNTTAADDNIAKKLLAYNRANRSVAILCNHQRTVPKSFGKSMEGLQAKIDAKKAQVDEAKKEFNAVKKEVKSSKNPADKKKLETAQRKFEKSKEQLEKLQLQATDREENKTIALGTSKLNYLDPRITVAWCKKFSVPIEKVYNKTQRDKFQWAIDMTDADFEF